MKRSNRLILLIGLFLAVVAFVGIVVIFQGQPSTTPGGQQAQPTELPTAFAKAEIPLGLEVTADNCETRTLAVTKRDATAFNDCSILIGRIARQRIAPDHQFTAADFTTKSGTVDVPEGKRGIAVQVDQLTGVGTLINAGDHVDMVVGITGDEAFPVITIDPETNEITRVENLNPTSVKLLLSGLQVLETLLPPPPAAAEGQAQPAQPQAALTGGQELVILAVTAQQAEIVKFAQVQTGGSISLALRSARDFRDPLDPSKPFEPAPDVTTGIILKTLVDEYGVIPPQLIETVLPAQSPAP